MGVGLLACSQPIAGSFGSEGQPDLSSCERLDSSRRRIGSPDDDRVQGSIRSDCLVGEAGDDEIDGGRGEDLLAGGPGDDELRGGPGEDALYGGAGRDQLFGGAGADTLVGGAGADDFVIEARFAGEVDELVDFDAQEGDRIVLIGFDIASLDAAMKRVSAAGGELRVRLSPDSDEWQPVARLSGKGELSIDMLIRRNAIVLALEARF